MASHESFIAGYIYGKSPGARELTAREILERWPDADTDTCHNGIIDGLADDTWRLERIPSLDSHRPPWT